MPAEVTITRSGGTLTAALSGEIDHHTARELRESIDDAAERMRPQRLVLDFGGVGFMDSSGIGLIMGRCRLIRELGGELEVTGESPAVVRMIRLAGLGRLGIGVK